jgi:hypothetical protein
VESTNPHIAGDAIAEEVLKSLPKLTGCLVRKGNCKNLPWAYALDLNQVRNAVSDRSCFA